MFGSVFSGLPGAGSALDYPAFDQQIGGLAAWQQAPFDFRRASNAQFAQYLAAARAGVFEDALAAERFQQTKRKARLDDVEARWVYTFSYQGDFDSVLPRPDEFDGVVLVGI